MRKTARKADLHKVIGVQHGAQGHDHGVTHDRTPSCLKGILSTFSPYSFKGIKSTVIFYKINERIQGNNHSCGEKPQKTVAVRRICPLGEMRHASQTRKREPLTRKKQGDIVKQYFGNALAAVCGMSRISDNQTDERHRGSQLKVPKETGTFSRKNGPKVFFCFSKGLDLSILCVQIPFQAKTVCV